MTAPAETGIDRSWALGVSPTLATPVPRTMFALTLHRDQYGPPADAIRYEEVAVPRLEAADAGRVLVSVLASGPNFNTNFAALGLPVPVFPRGDSATLHVPGSDAVGIVVDAGPAVTSVKVGQAVMLDSWTGGTIRGYETHDGFNAQFALVDEVRAIPIPPALSDSSPERLAALLLTYGTAYRAVVERLDVQPGDSVLIMGGGKGTSFAGAQIAKTLGARVILVGSNRELADSLIERGIADAFVNRREIPADAYGVIGESEKHDAWLARTEPFRAAVFAANEGRAVDKIFEHTGGTNFPLLVSTLAGGGKLAFFGATGQGLKGEYKETFFYDQRRFVMDARWVWMRQKQVVFSSSEPREIFSEIGLLPGRKGLVWGADAYAQEFAAAALERGAELVAIASHSSEREGIEALERLGVPPANVIDRDQFDLATDMPDPLTAEGTPNDAYGSDFMSDARAIGRAIWGVFGPRVSPDFIVERPDQSTMHFSTFLVRDHDERDAMQSGYVVVRGSSDVSILGSHMYRDAQAGETVRLLADGHIVMEQDDLEIVGLEELPAIQQKMLDGTMTSPKGVALVQADRPGRAIVEYEAEYLGTPLLTADEGAGRLLDVRLLEGIAVATLTRTAALNALNEELLSQLSEVVEELHASGTITGENVDALILRGAGRSFVAGADIQVFVGKSAEELDQLAAANMAVFTRLENLAIPVVSLIDGFALGGGNELAMSTHYRIATENALLGQPEVKLGIIPGYGGMQRLPRLIGPRKAAEMAVNGESVDGREAVRIGLVHEFHASSTALACAFHVAQDLSSGRGAGKRADWAALASAQADELESLFAADDVAQLLGSTAPSDVSDIKAARSYAAQIALQALRAGYEDGFAAGLENDARLFGEVVGSESGQHWVGRFLAKDPEQAAFLTLLPPL
ncbi:MAG: enoyl-CoA hydratase-related protein [Gaiellaceae bacterium]